ncbi:alpha/beta fold hydrolase [Streptomyces sp. ISL-36]|uniref:alpha/beta fold hydrolase n=1 Tax=Streptomyces sp. ISL-36 TaxID=2819182 RepID=UPI001BE6FA6A|nr:alpha/beta hydrolase [Streptomyces sp. ISL-36]MBT2438761.1 alpha/beta fold hydrolase [Streptomyces sp. ISL-36]
MDEANSTLSRVRGRVVSGDGTRIAYERRGEGPPVILVSGALCTAESERPLAELLAPHFSVVTYDRRGRGGSGDTRPYTVEREIDDLAALLDEVGGRAGVHGMSSGGALALAAAGAGLSIGQLSVYEPPFSAEPGARETYAARRHRLTGLLDRGERGAALELFLADAAAPEALAGMRGSAAWPALEAVAHTLAYDQAVLGDGTVPAERLAGIHARVLVVDGGASPAWTRRAAQLVSTALPRGRHRTLTGQTHAVAPHVLAPVLDAFFADE